MLWADNMQIPIGAPHAWTAEVFMNYVYDPEVQAKIAEDDPVRTPVKGVKEVLAKKDPKLAENQLIFPDAETLEDVHIFNKLSPDDEAELNDALPADHRGVSASPWRGDGARPRRRGIRIPRRRSRTCCWRRACCGWRSSSWCRCTSWRASRWRAGRSSPATTSPGSSRTTRTRSRTSTSS